MLVSGVRGCKCPGYEGINVRGTRYEGVSVRDTRYEGLVSGVRVSILDPGHYIVYSISIYCILYLYTI